MRKTKCIRLFALILTVAMMCTAMSMAVFAEPGDEGNGQTTTVEYYDENGCVRSRSCIVVTDTPDETGEIVLEDGWYQIHDLNSIMNRIHILGDVHLVVNNGYSDCAILKGIRVSSGNSLSVYSAVDNKSKLVRSPGLDFDSDIAIIGGDADEDNGDIFIYGSEIVAIGYGHPTIGKGRNASGTSCGDIKIVGGNLQSQGGFINLGSSGKVTCSPGITPYKDDYSETYTVCDNHDDTTDNDGICDLCNAPLKCNVTFDTQGGSAVDAQEVDFNGTVEEPANPEKNGATFAGWYCDGEPYDFRNLVRSDKTIVAKWEDGKVARAQSATVIYEGGLKLRFTLKFSELLLDDANAYVTFTKNGEELKTYPLAGATDENGVAQFAFPIEAPDWMEEVKVAVYDGEGNKVVFRNANEEEYQNDELAYSVYQHCLDADAYSESYRALVENGLYYYCANAQKYFDHNAAALGDLDITPPSVTVADSYKMSTSGSRPSWLTSTSLRVNFLDNNTLRATFVLSEDEISNYSFLLKDSEGNPVTTSAKRLGKGKYALDAEGISAANLTNAYTFTITNNSTQESYTITASCMSYAIMSMQKGTTQEMKDLGQAFYLYGLYADAYFSGQ